MTPEFYQYSLFLTPEEKLKSNIVLFGDRHSDTLLETWKNTSRFGFDIETFSKHSNPDGALHPEQGEIRLLQIAVEQANQIWVWVIDLLWEPQERAHIHYQLATLGFWDILALQLKNPQVEVVGHSLDFEQKWMLAKYQMPIRCIRDTKLMSQVYWAGLDPWLPQLHGKPHSLESVGRRLDIEINKQAQTSDWGWGELGEGRLSNNQLNYAARDAEVVLAIHDRLEPLLKLLGVWNSYLAECYASPAFAQMSHYGMPVNSSQLNAVLQQYHLAYDHLITQLNRTFPEAIPYLYSPKKLPTLINSKFNLKLTRVAAETLSDRWDIPELRLISIIKTTKTYLDYLESLQKNQSNGYVKGNYTQINRMAFGRSSCSEPNLQTPPNPSNFPVELKPYNLPPIRSIFQPAPCMATIVCDLSKAHSRIACEASGDPQLTSRFNSDSQDIFCSIVETIAAIQRLGSEWTLDNIPQWIKNKSHPNHDRAKLLRAVAKAVHYGCLNLQGAKTLQTTVRTGSGIDISLESAQNSQQGWKKTYPTLAKFQRQIVRDANQISINILGNEAIFAKTKFGLGYVKCLTGRGVFLPKYPQDFDGRKSLSVRGPDACAAYWTMAESDIIKLAMGECVLIFEKHPEWSAWIANCCHDEIIAIAKEPYALEVATTVQQACRNAMRRFIRTITVDEGDSPEKLICSSWADK